MTAAAEVIPLAPKLAKAGKGRPSQYKTKDGTRVPGVTTIVNRFKESGGLIHWAWEQGRDGKDYRASKDAAADVGHAAHALVEAKIHGRELPTQPETMSDEDWQKALTALQAFSDWADQTKLEIVDTEVPAVSELWRFGGTRDCLAKVNGTLMLLDWKSSNSVYRDYIVQVAAYRMLAREQGHGVDAAGLLRFGKDHGDFTYYSWPGSVLDLGWESFRYMRDLYELDAKLKMVVR